MSSRWHRRLAAGALGLALLFVPLPTAAAGASQTEAAAPRAPAPPAAGAGRQILVTIAQPPPRMLGGAGSTPRGYRAPPTYRAAPRSRRIAARLARDYGLRHLDAWPIELLGVHCVVFEAPEEVVPAELLERLGADPRVESAQPMQLFEVLGRTSYDDPYLHLQHAFLSLQVEQAHRFAQGKGVRLAVVDTGIDVGHPELAGRIEAAENFVDGDPLTFVRDVHGTGVAGIIASLPDNGIGIAGVAPSARVLALKACWSAAGGEGAVCSTFTLAKAISFAAQRGADLLNLSLTGPPDPLLSELLGKLIARGTVVVAAAVETDPTGFPASLDDVIAVAADRDRPARAGTTTDPPRHLLRAPGEDVLTIRPEGSYDFMSGSSLAAAHVSGIVALLLEHRPRLTAGEIFDILEASSRTDASPSAGRTIDACGALARILGAIDCGGTAEIAGAATRNAASTGRH